MDNLGKVGEPMATDLERTAFHEAGHFIVLANGDHPRILQDLLSIVPNDEDGSTGRVIAEGLERCDDPSPERIEAHVVSLFAGYRAQRRFDPGQSDAEALAEAGRDFWAAAQWRNAISRKEGIARADALLAEHWPAVEIVAKALLHRRKLDATEADLLTVLVDDDAAAVARAASILISDFGWDTEDLCALTGVKFMLAGKSETRDTSDADLDPSRGS